VADLENKLCKLKQPQDKAGLPDGSVDCRKARQTYARALRRRPSSAAAPQASKASVAG